MVFGKGLEEWVTGRAPAGGFCPCGPRGSTHLLSSGPQRVQMSASDVNCGTCLTELQGDATANTPGSTSHHTHLALHRSCHDSQTGVKSAEAKTCSEGSLQAVSVMGYPDGGQEGEPRLASFEGILKSFRKGQLGPGPRAKQAVPFESPKSEEGVGCPEKDILLEVCEWGWLAGRFWRRSPSRRIYAETWAIWSSGPWPGPVRPSPSARPLGRG